MKQYVIQHKGSADTRWYTERRHFETKEDATKECRELNKKYLWVKFRVKEIRSNDN